jgi:hypothetical protein
MLKRLYYACQTKEICAYFFRKCLQQEQEESRIIFKVNEDNNVKMLSFRDNLSDNNSL